MNRIGRRVIMCMMLIAARDQEHARALMSGFTFFSSCAHGILSNIPLYTPYIPSHALRLRSFS
jgi:hypothetical protein